MAFIWLSHQTSFCITVVERFYLALFNAFDENQDGHIDFREIACAISTCCRGPVAERFTCKWRSNIEMNVVCCVGRVEIQIKIYKGQCTANTDSIV